MFRNFNLPHGNSEVDEDGEGQQTSCLGKSDSDDGGEVQRLLDITKGFSDDEHCEAAFERSYPGPKHKKTPRSKNKKSPRRSDDDEPEILSPKTKKPRNLSIFGGPLTYTDEDADDEGMPPKTPGQGIGMRMSSLTLEQQHESFPDSQDQLTDNGEGSSRPRGGLGTGLDLLDGEDSQAPSDHSSTLDDDDYLMQPENAAISYGLRRNIDRTVAPATWVDVDRSGNYDPDAEAREKALKLNKAKAKKKNKGMPPLLTNMCFAAMFDASRIHECTYYPLYVVLILDARQTKGRAEDTKLQDEVGRQTANPSHGQRSQHHQW